MEREDGNSIRCGRYLVTLLHATLYDVVPPEKPQDITYEELFQMARKHCVETMSYEAVARLREKPEDSLWSQWRKYESANIAKNLMQRSERDRILTELVARDIDALPMKGCQLIEMYPKPEYRQMSDLDILIRKDQVEEVRDCMLELGYESETFGITNEDTYRRFPFMNIEMHHALINPTSIETLLKEYYADPWSRAVPDGPHRFRYSWEDYYVYLLAHFYKHFSSGGSGIRNVMDIHVFLSQYGDRLDRDYVGRELDQMDLNGFCITMEDLARRWFGEEGGPSWGDNSLEETIFTSGAYGLRSRERLRLIGYMSEKNGTDDRKLGIRYILWLLFPDYQRLVGQYPQFAGKQKILPLLWIYRIGDKVLHERKKIRDNLTALREYGENQKKTEEEE